MEARAVVRHVRMSPRKMRVVADLVRGKRVDEAMAMLKLMPKKGAAVIRKLLSSAVANAEHAGQQSTSTSSIRDCNVDNGPILKRWMPRAMGRATAVQEPHQPRHRRRVATSAGRDRSTWVRKYIRSASASASSRPGRRSGTRRRTTPSGCTRTSSLEKFVKKKLEHAGIAGVEIERAANKVKINIHTARPGIVIGKRGAGVEQLKKDLQALTENEVFLNIHEVRKAETDAQLVAENIATQLERRIAFRRAMKKAVQTAMKFGAKGIRVACVGPPGRRRDGALRVVPRGSRAAAHAARRHRLRLRRGQDHLRHDRRARCWIFKGEVLPTAARRRAAARCRQRRARTYEARDTTMLSAEAEPSTARCRRAACAARPSAATSSPSATSACRPLECGWITARQIEAARIAMTRHIKRGGKVCIRIFPDKPITKKPAETRMGNGKGGNEGLRRRRQARAACSTRWKASTRSWRARPSAWRTTSCRSRPASCRAKGCCRWRRSNAHDRH